MSSSRARSPRDEEAPAQLELVASNTVHSSRALYSFTVHEHKRERAISWYDQNNAWVLRHLIPRGKVPYTKPSSSTHPGRYRVTYCDVRVESHIHGFAFDTPTGQPQMFTPNYHFSTEQQSIRFQSAARQKQLLHTFQIHQIRRHNNSRISFEQPLKLWQRAEDQSVTFTFFAHINVDTSQHYEFDLAWFKKDATRRDSKTLVLTFYTHADERRDSTSGKPGFLDVFKRKKDGKTPENDQRLSPTSTHSRSSSISSDHRSLPNGERVVTPHQAYLNFRSLQIEFADANDVDGFLELCHNPSSAPGPLAAPESLWKIDDGLAETVHMLQPIGNSYTSTKKPSHVISFQRGEDETVTKARDWLSGLHGLREHFHLDALEVPPVGIAVFDTGIDATNPAIADTWGKGSQRYRNFLEDSITANNLTTESFTRSGVSQIIRELHQRGRDTPQDDTGHGTHVAGIILQLCPEANLCIGRVMADNVTTEEEDTRAAARRLALAILYATDVWKVKIISLSIGFRKLLLATEEKEIVRNAIKHARNAEVIIFAAASNEGNRDRILFPAGEPEPFCINSSNGYGEASEFNPPHQEQHENFSILGEGVKSTWLQNRDSQEPTLAVRRGTSVATPIAASVVALIIHFGRQWEPVGYEKLETRRGIKCILKTMATKNARKFYDIVPWLGVFELTTQDLQNPIQAAMAKIAQELETTY